MELIGENLKLPISYRFNRFVCFKFLQVGIHHIRIACDASKDENLKHVLLADGAVGVSCFAQGLELLMKAAICAKRQKEPRGNHKLLAMYNMIADDPVLVGNLTVLSAAKGFVSNPREVVEQAEDSFMRGRYMGLKDPKDSLQIPDPDKSAFLVLAIVGTYFHFYWPRLSVDLGCSLLGPLGIAPASKIVKLLE